MVGNPENPEIRRILIQTIALGAGMTGWRGGVRSCGFGCGVVVLWRETVMFEEAGYGIHA